MTWRTPVVGKGMHGIVYDLEDGRVIKVARGGALRDVPPIEREAKIHEFAYTHGCPVPEYLGIGTIKPRRFLNAFGMLGRNQPGIVMRHVWGIPGQAITDPNVAAAVIDQARRNIEYICEQGIQPLDLCGRNILVNQELEVTHLDLATWEHSRDPVKPTFDIYSIYNWDPGRIPENMFSLLRY